MQNRFVFSLATLASVAVAAPAFAQGGGSATMTAGGHVMEYGIDAGADFQMGTPKITRVNVPGDVRIGFFLNDRVSLEPMVNFQSVSGGGGSSYGYTAALGLLWHFNNSPVGDGPYVRPFAGFTGNHSSGGGTSSSNSDGLAGAGLGVKLPWGEHMAWRFEANYAHVFADNPGNSGANNHIGLNAGLSYFTR